MGTAYTDTLLALQPGSLTKYLSQRDQPRQNTEQELKEIQLCLIVIDKTIPGLKKKKSVPRKQVWNIWDSHYSDSLHIK